MGERRTTNLLMGVRLLFTIPAATHKMEKEMLPLSKEIIDSLRPGPDADALIAHYVMGWVRTKSGGLTCWSDPNDLDCFDKPMRRCWEHDWRPSQGPSMLLFTVASRVEKMGYCFSIDAERGDYRIIIQDNYHSGQGSSASIQFAFMQAALRLALEERDEN